MQSQSRTGAGSLGEPARRRGTAAVRVSQPTWGGEGSGSAPSRASSAFCQHRLWSRCTAARPAVPRKVGCCSQLMGHSVICRCPDALRHVVWGDRCFGQLLREGPEEEQGRAVPWELPPLGLCVSVTLWGEDGGLDQDRQPQRHLSGPSALILPT